MALKTTFLLSVYDFALRFVTLLFKTY